MATIYDIAKKVGCDSSTVSRALNGTRKVNPELKAKILKTAEEMNYVTNVAARNLIMNQSWNIGIIYHESLELGLEHQHFGGILQGFKVEVESKGYDITFVSRRIGEKKQTYLEWCKSRKIDGVLIVTIDDKDDQLINLINGNIPVVSVNKVDLNCATVVSDNIQGTNYVMEYFKKNSTTNIGHISLPLESFAGTERRETYIKYMKQWNSFSSDLIVVSEGYEYIDGYNATKKLFEQCDTRPDGIYVATDMLALGALSFIKDMGYNVPEDVEIIGFDDLELAKYVTPSLTTIAQNQHLIGKTAGEILVSHIDDKKLKKNDLLLKIPVKLIERNSTKKRKD